ncbi:hypothetical protein D3C80_1788120 [compost metagenome]
MKWTDANVAGETGQTTEIYVKTTSGLVIQSYTGLTGTSHEIPVTALGQNTQVVISAYARRNGKLSLQGFSIAATVTPTPRLALQGDQSGALMLEGRDGFLQLEGDY